jgi:hypothetical protein
MFSTLGSLAMGCLMLSGPALAEAVLRTTAYSTLSQVTYSGRDYAIRSYALRHNLEWKNTNEEFDLQLHEQLSDTFPPFATIVRDLVRAAKAEDSRELSGSENAQVLGVYGTNPGPVVVPTRDYTYAWSSDDAGIRTDEADGKVVGRFRVVKRKISDDVELIQQALLDAPKGGGVVTKSQETSCFRFKQPRWMWSELVPAPLEPAAAAFEPLVYAVDNAWNQLKECRAAKGSCESLDKIYLRAVEARDKVWKDDATIQQLRDIGRKPGARGFAFTRFPEDIQVDEQGWLVLDQGSGYLNHLGEKTDGENLIAPADAMQNILEQQQLLAQGAAAQARAEPSATKPEPGATKPERSATKAGAAQPVSEARSSASHSVEAQGARSPVAEAAAPATPKTHSAGRSEAKSPRHAHRERAAVARLQRAEPRTRPLPRVVRVVRAPDEDIDEPMMPLRRWLPLEPPPRYEVRVRRDVSPFHFLFSD